MFSLQSFMARLATLGVIIDVNACGMPVIHGRRVVGAKGCGPDDAQFGVFLWHGQKIEVATKCQAASSTLRQWA